MSNKEIIKLNKALACGLNIINNEDGEDVIVSNYYNTQGNGYIATIGNKSSDLCLSECKLITKNICDIINTTIFHCKKIHLVFFFSLFYLLGLTNLINYKYQ